MAHHELFQLVKARIKAQGRLTFADYMATCLYEPGLGYYTSSGRKVGLEGDFYTSITVHAAFGRVIAREVAAAWQSLGSPTEFTVMEVGAGHGRLACDILDFLQEREPHCYKAIKLILVEKEPSLVTVQRQLMQLHTDKLSWLTPAQLADFSFKGMVYSNELLDAMPVHRVLMTESGLREIYVTCNGDELQEQLDLPSTPALAEYLARYGMPLMPGQEAEISLAALSWFETMATVLTTGFILTVDYGYGKEELYSPHRKLGTLLCYYRHQIEDNPYIRLGEQDITSHINFSALMEKGMELGMKTVWFGEQCRFLLAAGMVEEFEAVEAADIPEKEKLKKRLTLKRLIMPEGGMGDTFKVLLQSKGVEKPSFGCLKGFRI